MRPPLPVLLAAALALVALAWDLGGYPLLEPDEGRNAEVMRELEAGGAWWMPRLNGLPYVDKPIVHFAAGAAALRLAGRTETAARLPSLLFSIGTVLVVGWFATRLAGRDAGWTAAIMAATTPFTVAYARTVIFDATLTFFVTAALAAFFVATEAEAGTPPARRWSLVAWAAVGLGVLTKGPVALATPLLVAVPYAGWRRRAGAILDPAGMLVLLAIVLPWLVAVSFVVPDFLRYVLLVETAQRLGTDVLGRSEPWWYFLAILPVAALPWSAALAAAAPAGWRALRRRGLDRRAVFAALWIALPLLLFSLSRSKRPQYVLPLIPPIALLVALWWQDPAHRAAGVRRTGVALAVIGGVLLGFAWAAPSWIATRPEVAALIPPTARWLGIVALGSGAAGIVLAARRWWALAALVAPVAAIPVVGMPLMRAIGEDRSSRGAAEALAPHLLPGTEVVAIGVFPLSLPFYLDRTFTLVTDDAAELTSNYLVRRHDAMRRAPRSPLRPPGWWREALATCDRPRVFLVAADAAAIRHRLEEVLPLQAATRKFAAYGPCGGGALARGP